mmetsp:Transcript_23717/g.34777  ORF Transcript_23717/g.34777 Transcript_23717/m.34777 type:complete len:217 (+) Transcript_23717:1146-1796(+)
MVGEVSIGNSSEHTLIFSGFWTASYTFDMTTNILVSSSSKTRDLLCAPCLHLARLVNQHLTTKSAEIDEFVEKVVLLWETRASRSTHPPRLLTSGSCERRAFILSSGHSEACESTRNVSSATSPTSSSLQPPVNTSAQQASFTAPNIDVMQCFPLSDALLSIPCLPIVATADLRRFVQPKSPIFPHISHTASLAGLPTCITVPANTISYTLWQAFD